MKIEVILTEEAFRRFTLFDVMKRRKMWRSPALFATILCLCGCACFLKTHISGAVMLGCVLLVIGLGMPVCYFAHFYLSLAKQIKALELPKSVYTLHLTQKASGISIDNGREHVDYQWKDVFHVYRHKNATYLFMAPTRGFILPHECIAEGPDALWKLLMKKLPSQKYSQHN